MKEHIEHQGKRVAGFVVSDNVDIESQNGNEDTIFHFSENLEELKRGIVFISMYRPDKVISDVRGSNLHFYYLSNRLIRKIDRT